MGSYTSMIQNIGYGSGSGRLVDSYSGYSVISNLVDRFRKLTAFTDRFKRKKSIEDTLAEADVKDVSALILYEPKIHSDGFLSRMFKQFEYHFIAIARTPQDAQSAIDTLYKWGFGGGGSVAGDPVGPDNYTGSNGLYGERHYVIGDFTKRVKKNPKQRELLFIPIRGLVSRGNHGLLEIETEMIKKLVESVRLC